MSGAGVFRRLLDMNQFRDTPFEGLVPFKSTEHWASGKDALRALNLLPSDEKVNVLKFYRHTDAKLCLGSCLLKRRAISEVCEVP